MAESWVLQRNASHSNNLLDVSFADLNNGWAVGGEQLHTTDGGATWIKQNTGLSVSFSVFAVSPTVAWVGGIQDLVQTTDGGTTWTREQPSNTAWFCLNFLDADNGWAGGQDQIIDDVPGSIWKRAGSPSSIADAPAGNGQLGSTYDSSILQVPPSAPRDKSDSVWVYGTSGRVPPLFSAHCRLTWAELAFSRKRSACSMSGS